LINFDYFCTVGNKNEYFIKNVQIVLFQPNYVSTLPGKTKNNTKTADRYAPHSVERIALDFRRKLFNVRFLTYLLENSFGSLLA